MWRFFAVAVVLVFCAWLVGVKAASNTCPTDDISYALDVIGADTDKAVRGAWELWRKDHRLAGCVAVRLHVTMTGTGFTVITRYHLEIKYVERGLER